MKFASFLTLFVLLNVHNSDVECGLEFIKQMYDIAMEPIPRDPEKVSLVLGVETRLDYVIIANCPIQKNVKNPDFGKYLFACPAETQEEVDINREKSNTKHAFFIKDSYGNINLESNKKIKKSDDDQKIPPPNANDLDQKNYQDLEYYCKNPVGEPSIKFIRTMELNGIEIDHYFIGFEVYMGEKYKKFITSEYDKFLKLNPGFKWYNVLIIRIESKRKNVLTVNAETFSDESTSSSSRFQHSKRKTQVRSNLLGSDIFFKGYKMENIYSVERQGMLFRNLFRDSRSNIYFNRTQGRYLVETYLAPLHSFVNPLLEKAALTYGNIAPMWKMIRETSWARLEDHILHLVQGVYGVYVINGTYGTLKLAGKEIHLGPRKSVRVPLAFYKIVSFMKKAKEFYNMLIITMNNPYENVSHGLCEVSQCKEFGWDYIEEDFYPYGRTSCCELTNDIIDKLLLNGFIAVDKVLDLRAVPYWENDKITLNVTNYIEDQKGPAYNPNIMADHLDYQNEKDIALDSLNKGKKEDDEVTFTKFALAVFNDYLVPGLTFLSNKAKDYVGSKVSSLRGQQDDVEAEKPLLSDQKDESTVEKSLSSDQKDESAVEKSLSSDQKDESAVEKSLSNDQKDEHTVEKSLSNDQKDEHAVEKSLSNDQKDEHAVEKSLSSDQKDENTVEKSLSSDQKVERAVEKALSSDQKDESRMEKSLSSDQKDVEVENPLVSNQIYEPGIGKSLPVREIYAY